MTEILYVGDNYKLISLTLRGLMILPQNDANKVQFATNNKNLIDKLENSDFDVYLIEDTKKFESYQNFILNKYLNNHPATIMKVSQKEDYKLEMTITYTNHGFKAISCN